MDMFKQALAPIPEKAWDEINERAEEVIKSVLTARKTLHVEGPGGLGTQVVTSGRLNLFDTGDKNVDAGLYEAKSLMETRVTFELSKWELDNLDRGVDDVELDALEEAVKHLAEFEEDVLYNGNKNAMIKGLKPLAETKIDLKDDPQALLAGINEGMLALKHAFALPPHNLVVGEKLYQDLHRAHGAKLLKEIVENMIGGSVILSEQLKGGLLMPVDHDDLEMTIGQDYTIGYEAHDDENVRFFVMNAFTLRVLDETLIVSFDY